MHGFAESQTLATSRNPLQVSSKLIYQSKEHQVRKEHFNDLIDNDAFNQTCQNKRKVKNLGEKERVSMHLLSQ